jgi:hypothetical protein
VIDLSRYAFEALRKDDEFILYRGRKEDNGGQVLVLSPVVTYPTLESLKRLEQSILSEKSWIPGGLPDR